MRLSFYVYMSLRGWQLKDLTCAEIGVYKGENALSMIKSVDNIKDLYLIDTYAHLDKWFTDNVGQVFPDKDMADMFMESVKEKFLPYGDKVHFVRKDSCLAANDFPNESFDYVYIDGGHDYEIVKKDIEAWYPKIKPYGVLGGHDVSYLGVSKAITEFSVNNKIMTFMLNIIQFKTIPQEFNDLHDWWIFKFPDNGYP